LSLRTAGYDPVLTSFSVYSIIEIENDLLGIDRGGFGAIAAVGEHIRPSSIKNESTEREIADWLSAFPPSDSFAVIEKVSSCRQMGASSAFTFGWSYGFLSELLICREISLRGSQPTTLAESHAMQDGWRQERFEGKGVSAIPRVDHHSRHRRRTAVGRVQPQVANRDVQ
jgi:hypothetical protein